MLMEAATTETSVGLENTYVLSHLKKTDVFIREVDLNKTPSSKPPSRHNFYYKNFFTLTSNMFRHFRAIIRLKHWEI
jgi:hypothetical protein